MDKKEITTIVNKHLNEYYKNNIPVEKFKKHIPNMSTAKVEDIIAASYLGVFDSLSDLLPDLLGDILSRD